LNAACQAYRRAKPNRKQMAEDWLAGLILAKLEKMNIVFKILP
jgi:hypothetical protein